MLLRFGRSTLLSPPAPLRADELAIPIICGPATLAPSSLLSPIAGVQSPLSKVASPTLVALMKAAELVSAVRTGRDDEADEDAEAVDGEVIDWREARWIDLAFFARSLAA